MCRAQEPVGEAGGPRGCVQWGARGRKEVQEGFPPLSYKVGGGAEEEAEGVLGAGEGGLGGAAGAALLALEAK